MKMDSLFACIVIFMFLPVTCYAKVFSNSYVSFVLPDNWECELEGHEYICTIRRPQGVPTDKIFILAAKIAGAQDNFVEFSNHLSKNLSSGIGDSLVNGPTYNKVNTLYWIDATHLDSEIPGYYTRYMVTVFRGISILVTFTSHHSVYESAQKEFLQSIRSMKVNPDWHLAK